MEKNKRKNRIIGIIAILALALSAISLGTSLGNVDESESNIIEIGYFDWTLGNINESGKIVESKKTITTEDYINVDGISITVEKDATVTYKVAYYNTDKEFISVTGNLSADYAETAPEGAAFVKIFVTPNQIDGEDVVLGIFNTYKYISQIEVKSIG